MSVETSNRVWKRSAKGGALLLLLLAMADWSDDWGYCHPSVEQMAFKCRQTDRNILNLIRELEQVGEVRRVARGKGGRGKFTGSVYQVTVGMNAKEITSSEQISPLARATLAKLQSGEMGRPNPRKIKSKTDEKISGENFSPEKQSLDFSPVSLLPLNVLINTSDSITPPPSAETPKKDLGPEERAEALYRMVRPTHLTLPNSEQRSVALKVLGIYLKRFDSPQEAAGTLRPYAAEADARGISPTNLCWLSEWAAVGQIPRQRRKWRTNANPSEDPKEDINYDAIRKRMEVELTPMFTKANDKRSVSGV